MPPTPAAKSGGFASASAAEKPKPKKRVFELLLETMQARIPVVLSSLSNPCCSSLSNDAELPAPCGVEC